MSLEENKRIALELMAANAADDVKKMDQLLADDVTIWVLPSTPFSGEHPKAVLISKDKPVAAFAAGPFTLTIEHVTAEEDRVAVTARGHMKLKNGKTYENVYHNLFFIRDGQIRDVREYFDTAHFNDVFDIEELLKLKAAAAE